MIHCQIKEIGKIKFGWPLRDATKIMLQCIANIHIWIYEVSHVSINNAMKIV